MILPPDTDDTAWLNLPTPARMSSLDRRLYHAGQLYHLVRSPLIAGIKRHRIERQFAQALCPVGFPGIMSWKRVDKHEVFLHLTIARLHGVPLPAPLEFFKP